MSTDKAKKVFDETFSELKGCFDSTYEGCWCNGFNSGYSRALDGNKIKNAIKEGIIYGIHFHAKYGDKKQTYEALEAYTPEIVAKIFEQLKRDK